MIKTKIRNSVKKVTKKLEEKFGPGTRWDQLQTHSEGSHGGVNKIKVTCYGGAEEVTGSNFMLEYKGKSVLIDCGLPQGQDSHHKEWIPFGYDVSKVDFLLVTHAHMDHIGRIPFLVKSGFRGKIFSTKPTKEMALPAFNDALHILTKDLDNGKIEELPYQQHDIDITMSIWKTVEYHENLLLTKDLNAKLFNSAHVLGSAFIQLICKNNDFKNTNQKVLFTGDMGINSLLLQEPDIPMDSDIVFMESVYGGRLHEDIKTRNKKLFDCIKDVIEKRSTLVIPAFAIERTQEILAEINNFVESHKLPIVPVFLDSPLAIEMTKVFHKHKELMSEKIQRQIAGGDDIFKFPGLHITDRKEESQGIGRVNGPKVIIAGSGMVAGGRVVHHVRDYLESDKNTILLAGYQAVGTYGRLLSEGKKEIVFYGELLQVRAKIIQLSGYSAHRDQNSLLDFVKIISKNCKSLNLILGDKISLLEFQKVLYERQSIHSHICIAKEVIEF